MDEKKRNIILGIILALLMIIAIAIVILNPNKVKTVNYVGKNEENNTNEEINTDENEVDNRKLEKE